MNAARLARGVLLAAASVCLTLSPAASARAASFAEFVDPNPAAGNQFGYTVVALSTGNVVITSPSDDAGGPDAGAVYLFNGATGALISTLRGSLPGDQVGSDVTVLANGNFVVRSLFWNGYRGAVTWGSGTTGVSGVVSATNSLVGSVAFDQIGSYGVTALSNGNYVVASPSWDNGASVDVGAATWGSGTTGVSGLVSAANSLVGSTAGDLFGQAVTALTNGNYVASSMGWDNGAIVNTGAATWCNGATGRTGTVTPANSLVGSTAGDQVGSGVTALANGNYVVRTVQWDNGAIADAGAVTWCNGTIGVSGAVSVANSLVGSTASDQVGAYGVTALSNGNYVVGSANWDNGAVVNAGAVTWGSGGLGVSGAVSVANSLVGSTAGDQVGSAGVTALSNGNYVVGSAAWDNGAIANAGAATWGSGTSGVSGAVSAANSLVGTTAGDNVGPGVKGLTNGNYVVPVPGWDNGATVNAGAVTWGSGTAGVSGPVSAANSLVGSAPGDFVGSYGVTPLTNGNYVVTSPQWNDGAIADVGAVTWGSGTAGVSGAVSSANSLVGPTIGDFVGANGVTALTNGNYVVGSAGWDNGAVMDAGAATWCDGTTGRTGAVSTANSLVGSTTEDYVGSGGVLALANGNYVVGSAGWNNGGIVDAGAVTWGNGATGRTGVIAAANSLVGSTAFDQLGYCAVLSNGNYVVASAAWDNGALTDAGAATWGNGTVGVSGSISAANSLVGTSPSTSFQGIVEDEVNGTFLARFVAEGGGRVRVGAAGNDPVITSVIDIPADQGGWLRLTLSRSQADDAGGSPPVATYGVWRHIPGTIASAATWSGPNAVGGAVAEASRAGQLRALLAGLDSREVEGRILVNGAGSRAAGITASFPPGTWELVTTIPALQQVQYVVAVPTISNAAPNDFVVTAHTTTPSSWFISPPASGQSVDNLAPAQPTQLTAAYSGAQTDLQWAANGEHDLGAYHVHRGTSADFTPTIGNRIAAQIASSYADVGPPGGYYKVGAVDVNGNVSSFALVTPQQTTGVESGSPIVFALEGVRPNPAVRNQLNVTFALPTGAAARLDLVDVGGRRVISREVGSLGVGRHTVNLSERGTVASGVYWVRLSQGANLQSTRITVIE